jgi:hypothetical protein
MATKEVTLLRSFAFTDESGEQHYFTRDNQDTILEIVGEANLQPYVDNNIIDVFDGHQSMPKTPIKAVPKGPGLTPSATTASAAHAGKSVSKKES